MTNTTKSFMYKRRSVRGWSQSGFQRACPQTSGNKSTPILDKIRAPLSGHYRPIRPIVFEYRKDAMQHFIGHMRQRHGVMLPAVHLAPTVCGWRTAPQGQQVDPQQPVPPSIGKAAGTGKSGT